MLLDRALVSSLKADTASDNLAVFFCLSLFCNGAIYGIIASVVRSGVNTQ